MLTKNTGGVLPYISYIGMCCPKGMNFGPFWSENRYIYTLPILVRETGMVFKGTMGTYERIDILFQFQMNKKELEICEFEMHLKKYFYLA